MGRPRNPERDKSMQRYLDTDGKIETAELAKLAGVPEVRIRNYGLCKFKKSPKPTIANAQI